MRSSRPSHKLIITVGVFAFLFASGLVFSQSPAPPPATGQSATPSPALKVSVRLIQVTVIAQDANGNPVTDLKKEDFTLRDQGQQQRVYFFAQQNTPASPATAVAATASSANFFSNHVESNSAGANSVTILLFDALNTQFRNLSYARTRVISYLQHMQPQDQVALYFLTPSKLYVMHDFTNDSATLVRLMGGKPAASANSPAANTAAPTANDAKIEKLMSDAFSESNEFFKGGAINRLETTSEAMLQIASNVVNIPGRKNLIWISGGFPIAMGAAVPIGSRDDTQDYTGTLSITAKQLGDANIAVYPVDARGLVGPRGGGRIVSPNMDAMVLIANGTGGRPFYNTNDIATSIRRAVDDSRVSYVLGYYPTNDKWDNRFREINIKVARPGVRLRYRTGYIATPANPTNVKRNELLTSDALRSPLQLIDLGLEVHAEPVAASTGRELKVNVRVDPNQMRFEKEGDHWADAVEVVWAGMSTDSHILDRDSRTIELRPTQTELDEIQHAGLSFSQNIHLGNEATELRLIVRENRTGAIGSVNIPLAGFFANSGSAPVVTGKMD